MKREFPLNPAHGKQSYFLYVVKLFTLFAIYFSTARLGLSLNAVSHFATLVWIPSGLAIAALLLFGYRLWPGILMGAFLVNLLTGAPLVVALGIGIGNTLEALVGTYLLKRNKFHHTVDHLRDVLVLIFLAMPLSALISATIGVSSLFLGRVIAFSAYYPTWAAWWIGDMISILIITPLILVWSQWPRGNLSRKRVAEMGILTVFVLAVGLIVFHGLLHSDQGNDSLTYLVFPPLIWAALRFGPRGTLSAIFALSTLAILDTIQGVAPFSSGRLSDSLFFLQTFMGIIAATSMILAAVMAERTALEQRKDEFISLAGHELKTPLTTIQGYTDLLRRKFAGSGDQEVILYLSKMATQTERLNKLIADLLDISKIQAGKIVFATEVVDINTLISEIVENLQHISAQHQITIEGSAQHKIVGDKDRLGQVVINLVTNAMKYSPRAARIIISLTSTRDTVTVSVQDFGIGIPTMHQLKVFDRFYRVHNDQDKTYPGLGIGLYIAHQIIEHHGGKLWVESIEGQGSTFSFSLPLMEQQAEVMAFSVK